MLNDVKCLYPLLDPLTNGYLKIPYNILCANIYNYIYILKFKIHKNAATSPGAAAELRRDASCALRPAWQRRPREPRAAGAAGRQHGAAPGTVGARGSHAPGKPSWGRQGWGKNEMVHLQKCGDWMGFMMIIWWFNMIYVFFGEYDGEVGLELGELGFLMDL